MSERNILSQVRAALQATGPPVTIPDQPPGDIPRLHPIRVPPDGSGLSFLRDGEKCVLEGVKITRIGDKPVPEDATPDEVEQMILQAMQRRWLNLKSPSVVVQEVEMEYIRVLDEE